MPKVRWQENTKLSAFTTWRVGGPADVVFRPQDRLDLLRTLPTIDASQPLLWLGLGSNTLIRDGGVPGITVITQGGLAQITRLGETTLEVEAGVSCAFLARYCARNCLAGAEFWAGIPGTVGGALRMNAGCAQSETWQFVDSVETVNRWGQVDRRSSDTFDVSYRHVDGLAPDTWFLSARMTFEPGDKQVALDKIKALLERRAATQPTGEYNGGSVFRNPENDHAGRLIESAGLKGHRLGGAFVSSKHANFITNDGSASGTEIEALVDHVASTVNQYHRCKLVREICVHGEAKA